MTTLLPDLVRKGLLVQEGSRRWATYRLSDRAAQAVEEDDSELVGKERMPPIFTRERRPSNGKSGFTH
jgi:DNA-binding transcriptional regulator PaaX